MHKKAALETTGVSKPQEGVQPYGPYRPDYKPPVPKDFDISSAPKHHRSDLMSRWTEQHAPLVADVLPPVKGLTTPPPPDKAVTARQKQQKWDPNLIYYGTKTGLKAMPSPAQKDFKPEAGQRYIRQDNNWLKILTKPTMNEEQLKKYEASPEMNAEQLVAMAARLGFPSVDAMRAYARAGQQRMLDRKMRNERMARVRTGYAGTQAV